TIQHSVFRVCRPRSDISDTWITCYSYDIYTVFKGQVSRFVARSNTTTTTQIGSACIYTTAIGAVHSCDLLKQISLIYCNASRVQCCSGSQCARATTWVQCSIVSNLNFFPTNEVR